MQKKGILILLILLNVVVLLGQIWPEGTPPFARAMNILTLISNLGYWLTLINKPSRSS